MAISTNVNQLEKDKFVESVDVPGQPGVVLLNPDGTAISAGGGGNVNLITGQTGVDGGEGAVSAKTLRVVTARVPKTFTDSTATATTSSGTILASNASRKMGTSIQNTSNSIGVFLNVTDAAVANQGWYLGPNSSFVMDENQFTTGAITGITASGSAVLSIMEAT